MSRALRLESWPALAGAGILSLMLSGCSAPLTTSERPYRDPFKNRPQEPALTGFAALQAAFRGVGNSVTFPQDDTTLTPEARTVLARQADWLSRHDNVVAEIEGHSDEQGTREFNLALGARRASSVQEYLIARGVEPSRLNTVSFGKERPAESCAEESCLAANRRAVTVIAPAPTAIADVVADPAPEDIPAEIAAEVPGV